MNKFYSYNSSLKHALLKLKVKPNAKGNLVNNFVILGNISYLKLSIKSIPEKGKANKEVINYLAKEWKLTRNDLEITKGHSNNFKTILIKNIDEEYLNLIINPYINKK